MAAPGVARPVPASIGEIDAAWISACLEADVTGVEVEPIGAGVGLMGQLARVRPAYAGGSSGPASVVVKLPSSHPENLGVAMHFRFYEREARFYSQLGDEVGVPVPTCYHATCEPEAGRFALVIEDLSEHRLGDQVAGADADDARRAVRTAAALHATWWDNPALESMTWLPLANDPVNLASQQAYQQAWPYFLDIWGHLLDADQKAMGEAVADRFVEMLDRYTAPPFTITHGDFRLDNLYFTADGRVVVADWQISNRGQGGVFDLVYFLGGSLAPEVGAGMKDELIATYREELAARGVDQVDDDQFAEATRVSALVCLLYPVIGGIVDLDNERGRLLGERLVKGYFGLAAELDAGRVL